MLLMAQVLDSLSATSTLFFMPRIHTHYDNLKVTRNAPPEVIRAAYKTLCQKFHPDRNPGNENAKKTFLIIRSAYETLSDPEKRKLHDAWISSVEALANEEPVSQFVPKPEKARASTSQGALLRRKKLLWQYGFWALIAVLIFIGFFFN